MATTLIQSSRIRSYLRAGQFYRNLNADDDDDDTSTIEIPIDCYRCRDNGASLVQFCQLINIMEFWMLDELPYGVTIFCLRNDVHVWKDAVIAQFGVSCAKKMEEGLDVQNIKIKRRDIPLYLRHGNFYRALIDDDPEYINVIPADCFNYFQAAAESQEEFCKLVRVMEYWQLDEIPRDILDYCHQHDVKDWINCFEGRSSSLREEILPLLLLAYEDKEIVPLDKVIKTGRWDLLKHVVSLMDSATYTAASIGNLRLLQYLHEQKFEWNEDTCSAASAMGHLLCLEYAHENGCPWDSSATEEAAWEGRIDCLQYAHEHGCPWDVEVYIGAASNGHLHCMQYAHQMGLEWHADVCSHAAVSGQLKCLQFAHENKCPWDSELYGCAAGGGHLTCMEYAHQNGLPWHADACRYAAFGGHLDCLQYAHENGCPWEADTVSSAAQNGHVACLEYALMHGCPIDTDACALASRMGHLECLQLLHQHNAFWDSTAPFHAAEQNRVDCLQYLHENQCPWDDLTTQIAAQSGCVECLRYAFENNCPHSEHIMEFALNSNNLEILQCLIGELGQFMDKGLLTMALLRGQLPCVQYLVDQACKIARFSTDQLQVEAYDKFFCRDNADFVLCVEYATYHGWVPDENFINYVVSRDQLCREWLITNGYYIDEEL